MRLAQLSLLLISLAAGESLYAQSGSTLSPNQVLIVYNSAIDKDTGGGGQIIFEQYRQLPNRAGVLGLDLNDPTLLPGNVSYADFKAKIRDPIRSHLVSQGLAEQVLVITLTRGIPHRVADLTDPDPIAPQASNLLGDRPTQAGEAFNNSNYTAASVDSELAFLFLDLDAGEGGGGFDSPADNLIRNPFFNSSLSITSADRTSVRSDRDFVLGGNYQVLRRETGRIPQPDPTDASQLFLTCRLDGHSVEDVVDMLFRAQRAVIDPQTDRVVIDEFDPDVGGPSQNTSTELDAGGLSDTVRSGLDSGGDFDQLAINLAAAGFTQVAYDQSPAFLIGESGSLLPRGDTPPDANATPVVGPVAGVFTFGGNHSSDSQLGYLQTFFNPNTNQSQFVPGAYFSSVESYNARAFAGIAAFQDQGSVADFIALGGTFAVGTVFEPFTIGVNEVDILLDRHLINGWSFVEAAFASVPFVSSQTIIVGDPLATATLGPRPVPVPVPFTVQLAPKIIFPTQRGVIYTVSGSADGIRFVPLQTIEGTGSVMTFIDHRPLATSRFYRVVVQ